MKRAKHILLGVVMAIVLFCSLGFYDTEYVSDNTYLRFGSDGDALMRWSSANSAFELTAIAIDTPWTIGGTTYGFDITYYFETAGTIVFDYDGDVVTFGDAMKLAFGTSSDITIAYDGTGNDLDILGTGLEVAFGVTDEGIDVIFHGETAGAYAMWDESADQFLVAGGGQITLNDSVELLFGTGTANAGDFSITGTSTPALVIDVVTAGTGSIEIGNDADDVPLTWFGETTGCEVTFTGDTVVIDGMALYINDDDDLKFGDSGEGYIEYDEDGHNIMLYHNGLLPDSASIHTDTANETLDNAADVGQWHICATDGVVWTLPAVATGLTYRVMNTGAAAAVEVHLDTNGADKILGGCGLTALDDGDKLTNTKASAEPGDYVVVTYGTADGWYVIEMNGTWADGGA